VGRRASSGSGPAGALLAGVTVVTGPAAVSGGSVCTGAGAAVVVLVVGGAFVVGSVVAGAAVTALTSLPGLAHPPRSATATSATMPTVAFTGAGMTGA
jgi:hypothetical protein